MVYSVTITPTALNDIQDALDYYNIISPNLGYRIADEIDASIGVFFQIQECKGKTARKVPLFNLFYL